ncbi:MAG TPA: DUF885 family protein [Gemmatimonadaceae bacterium]|nr:DUF885 family protein [Gemmatimonadaceae bacterium]
MSTSAAESQRRRTLVSLAIGISVAALSVWTVLDRGWVPFDEGTIAQAAERVLHGDVPHRDFTDPYTGGLPYWHALAMRVFGVSLMAPRYALFIAFLLWLPAVWWLARRGCGRRWAVAITILAAWWSLPVYPAAMPTWYLLFIATWIVVALERWHVSGHARWLVAVGMACGTAVTVKQTGLYLLAGALLGILFREQEDTRLRWKGATPAGSTDPIILLLLAVLGALVVKLLAIGLGSGDVLHLLFPITGVLMLAALREWRLTDRRVFRWRTLIRATGIVIAAGTVPVLIFLLPYLRHGALDSWFAGAVGAGINRMSVLHLGMRPANTLLIAVLPVYGVLLLEAISRQRRALRIVALVLGVALLWYSIRSVEGYRRLWYFGTSILPLAVGVVVFAGYRAWRANRMLDPVLLALAGITAFQALNQFPFSAPNYYAYVAPLAILTAGAAAAQFHVLPRLYAATLMLAGFSGIVLRIGSVHSVGGYPIWWDYAHRLAVPRGGLLVTTYDSVRYGRVVELVAQHRSSGAVYAGPELPEVYFLTATRSPGPDSYSLFSAPVADSAQLPREFNPAAADVLVIKSRPMFGPPLPHDVYQWLANRYPVGERIDTLEVRWRAVPSTGPGSFSRFVDGYLDAFARRHPSIAAGNGIHDHDDLLDDFSATAIAQEIVELKRERTVLAAFDPAALTPDERVDRQILDGIIDGWLLEQETLQNWRRNPMLYASALADGVHNLMTMESDSAPVRMRRAISKLAQVPALLAAARANVMTPPRLFAARGAEMMRGASSMLEHDLPLAFSNVGNAALKDSLLQSARVARPQLDAYASFLEREVVPAPSSDFAIGAANLARRFHDEELISTPLDEMTALGERELASTQAQFTAAAARLEPGRVPLQVWRDVQRDHPRRGEVVAATQRIVDSLAAFVRSRRLAALPEGERVVVAPSQPFDLGFGSMHASPPLEKTPVKSFYYITDARADQTPAEQEAWLERFNYASLTITSAHEAIPGHWLHSIYMRQTPGKVRRIWIGLNPFPQPSSGQDGWAHYAEQLIVDEGFGNADPRLRLAQLSDALTRICRLLSGIKLHTKQWTLDDAERCFEADAHLAGPAARREAERGTYDPTYGGYFLGKRGFLKLRADYAAKMGRQFDLRTFHERIMRNGIAPIWAHRQLLLPGDTAEVIK